jgi:hypothetical protein
MRSFRFGIVAMLAASSAAFGAVDQGLLNLVPAGTKILAGIQVDKSKTSPLGQFLLAQARPAQGDFQQLMDMTGFDPKRDLQELLFASTGQSGTAGEHPDIAVLARGYFDAARIKKALLTKGGKTEVYGGTELLTDGKDGHKAAIAILDANLAILGTRKAVTSIIDNRNVPATLDTELDQKVKSVSTANEAWFASIQPGSGIPLRHQGGEDGSPMNGAMLQSITQSSGGLHFGPEQIAVNFDALTRSAKDAQSLADVVRFFASMVQTQRQSQSPAALLAPSFDTMKLTTADSTMHLSFTVPEATAEQLVSEAHRPHQPRATQP